MESRSCLGVLCTLFGRTFEVSHFVRWKVTVQSLTISASGRIGLDMIPLNQTGSTRIPDKLSAIIQLTLSAAIEVLLERSQVLEKSSLLTVILTQNLVDNVFCVRKYLEL